MDWKREIVIAHFVKQKIAEADKGELWTHRFPEVAATEKEVAAAEDALGFRLDPSYREFLKHADGWKSFTQDVDLFGTSDLVGGARRERAAELLARLQDEASLCGFTRAELLPFAVSMEDVDVSVIAKPESSSPGTILWLGAELVDKYPSFDEWFLAMVDYNRLDYQWLTGKLQADS